MFCRKCGNKLDDDALFCSRCGLSTSCGNDSDNPREHIAEAPGDCAAKENEEPVAAFVGIMDETKRRSRRRMPLVALIALVTLLLSGAAWAAWTVYVEVVAPWIEAQQQQQEPVEEQAAEEEAEEEPEKTEPEATGDPRHVLQVAEILALADGSDMLSFIEDQGFSEEQVSSFMNPGNAPLTIWTHPEEDLEPFAALANANVPTQPQAHFFDAINSRQPGVEIHLGVDAMPPHEMDHNDLDGYTSTRHSLEIGETPSSIHIANLPLPMLSADEAARLLEEAGLGEALAVTTANPAEHAANAAMNNATELHAGFILVEGEQYFWYFVQRPIELPGTGAYVDSFIGCCTEQAALQAVIDSQLYAKSDWENATDEEKALMGAQAIAQGYYTAFDGYRNNVVTGDYECLCPESIGSETYIWADRDEFAALYGEQKALERFDNYIVGYEKWKDAA